ncbi:MAG: TIGR00730 family Rossman fold protein [Burkholderiales bacterium]
MSPSPTALRLCVYCGSRSGTSPLYTEAARALGTAIGARGWQLVYGGGRVGLMGTVADAALAAGAAVIGVIPESLMHREVGHAGLTALHVVPDMHQRKRLMAEQADAFLALPGGLGTLEEIFEVWTWRHLGYHAKPLALLNVAGYYNELLRFLQHAQEQDFIGAAQQEALLVEQTIDPLLDRIAALAQGPGGAATPADLSRI